MDIEVIMCYVGIGLTVLISLTLWTLITLKYVTSKKFIKRYYRAIVKITKKETEKICRNLTKDD